MQIEDKQRWPGIEWESEPVIIGTVGGEPLWLLGYEVGSNAPIVGRSWEPAPKAFSPFYLYELMGHSQDPIEITAELKAMDTGA
ncbi:MAG: hypothetical protein B0A82_19120 [Alkalinema sp. CACIAM 70d]|nr:MAG: hypothetical protein B0A82_19120 [Alkalinema sp. CACIAM 70d]